VGRYITLWSGGNSRRIRPGAITAVVAVAAARQGHHDRFRLNGVLSQMRADCPVRHIGLLHRTLQGGRGPPLPVGGSREL